MVAQIKGQLARKDRQMQIALWHGINQGRVSEINKDRKGKWRHIAPCPPDQLPPPPPYRVVPLVVVDKAAAYDEFIDDLEALIARLKLRKDKSNVPRI
jgi:hypothetical protein